MIGENHYLIFGGLVCKGQYHKTNVTKNLGILLYTYYTPTTLQHDILCFYIFHLKE